MMKTNWSVFKRRLKTPLQDYTTIASNRVSDFFREVMTLLFCFFQRYAMLIVMDLFGHVY